MPPPRSRVLQENIVFQDPSSFRCWVPHQSAQWPQNLLRRVVSAPQVPSSLLPSLAFSTLLLVEFVLLLER